MNKYLFLHVGCGKTGSSALQLWLNSHAETLSKEYGIYYPLPKNAKQLHDYAITSGNGGLLIDAIKKNNASEYLKKCWDDTNYKQGHLFFSSEVFQVLSIPEMLLLKKSAEDTGFTVKIIAYVRDVYDASYSGYSQLVKRHLFSESFSDFVLSRDKLFQFEVVKKFEQHFSDMTVLHYDSERQRGLENSLCEAIGIEAGALPEMQAKKVNRSLSGEELELLRSMNQAYTKNFAGQDVIFSTTLSDALIYSQPEMVTEIPLHQDVLEHLEKTMSEDVDYINSRYFTEGKLKIFDGSGKKVSTKTTVVPREYNILINTFFENIERFGLKKRIDDQGVDLVRLLVKAANNREKKSLEDALTLVKAAAVLRPKGGKIRKMLASYEERLASSNINH